MNRWGRLGLALLFATAALGLCVYGEATIDERSDGPAAEDVLSDYDSYVGERLLLFGHVLEVGNGEATIRTTAGSERLQLTVESFDANVEPGGDVQVYGTLQAGQRMAAERVVVVNGSASAKLWKYGASLVGLLGFLGLFAWTWRIDLRTMLVEVRGDG